MRLEINNRQLADRPIIWGR